MKPKRAENPSKKVLLTGFDPFDGDSINPSWEVVRALRGEIIASHQIVVQKLPTVFGKSQSTLLRAIKRHQPALVICLGQAGGRSAISLERVAINIVDARIVDNAGAQPIDQPILNDAPAAYFSNLPLKACMNALLKAGTPAEVSNTAGTFVCNEVFFALCHAIESDYPKMRGGFVHIPFIPQQATQRRKFPSIEQSRIEQALRIIVQVCIRQKKDVLLSAGTTH